MTVDELRQALADLPGDTPLGIAYPDLRNDRLQYETRDVRLGGLYPSAAGQAKPCFVLEAWGGL